ncbi:MAG TPA: winged helix-turn-helix domain-containing protein [Bryobacteraceae bacterium]|nr:winged helix-turn-helix domain-containing protein [Bryobacteraceae bacterium]
MGSHEKLNGSPRLIFGPFEYEETSGQLRKHGTRLRLQGQPLQILSTLLQQPSRVVSREEFHRRLWNGSTFVDFDHGLNAAVNRLRQVLGDSADRPRYIETLPSQGYRFIAPVRIAEPVAVPAPLAPETIVTTEERPSGKGLLSKSKMSFGGIFVGVALAALYIGYQVGARQRVPLSAQSVQWSVVPPKGYVLEPASSRQSMALSPSGSKLAFTAMNASGLLTVFVRDFRRLEASPVANTTGAHSVFWGSDERSIYFTTRGSLGRAALDGDSYQVISDSPAIISSVVSLSSGKLLLSGASGTFTVPNSGGALRPMKESYRWSQILPDGRHILYTVFDPTIGRHRTRVARFGEPGSAKDLLETDSRTMYTPSAVKPGSGYLLSVRMGNLLAHPFDPGSLRVTGEPMAVARRVYSFTNTGAADYSAGTGVLAYQRYVGRSQLAWVDRKGHVITTVGPRDVNLKYAAVSPDGENIATAIFDPDRGVMELWVISTVTGASRRLFTSTGVAVFPVWSPDSKRLVYGRGFAGSPPKLFMRDIGDSQSAGEALPSDFFQIPTDWSRDGRFVAFTNTGSVQVENELKGDVRLVDLASNRDVIHLVSTPFHEASPMFSPDGRWLAFTSNESGRAEVYLQAFQRSDSPRLVGERFLVSRDGAASLRWRRDGKELFCVGADGRLYAIPVELTTRPIIGKPVPLFEVSLEARGAIHAPLGFDVSPDGSRFLVPIATSSDASEIVIIQNWESALLGQAQPN